MLLNGGTEELSESIESMEDDDALCSMYAGFNGGGGDSNEVEDFFLSDSMVIKFYINHSISFF